MKSSLALLATSAAVLVAGISAAAPTAGVFVKKLNSDVPATCAGIITHSAFQNDPFDPTSFLVLVKRVDGAVDTAECTASFEAEYTAATDAAACFKDDAAVPGGSKRCPLALGSVCTKDQFCAPYTASPLAERKCPASLTCGTYAPADIGKVIKSVSKYNKRWEATDTLPAEFQEAYVAEYNKLDPQVREDCSSISSAPAYPDSKLKEWTALVGVMSNCDPAKFAAPYKTAIDTYNKDKENDQKLPLASVSYSTFSVDDYKKCMTDGSMVVSKCKSTEGCTIPCPLDHSCTEETKKNCSTETCVEDKCVANAFAAIVAPLIGAALAVAFIF